MSGTELGSGQAPPRPTLVRRIQARLARLLRTPHPTQVGVAAFAVAVLVVTALLMLPAAAETGKTTTFREALFTATSAVCVTGLAVVDTPTHWSAFGEVVCQPSAPRPVEREGQLSDPRGCNACSAAGAKLAADEAPRPKVPAPRVRQRAEDRLGPDGVFRLCADYVAGRPSTALVRSYGLSKGAELRLLEVSGISRRHRGLTETHVKEAVEWYLRGWPLTRIGDYFGKDHTVVRNALVREGVALRARRRDQHSAVQQPTSGSDDWRPTPLGPGPEAGTGKQLGQTPIGLSVTEMPEPPLHYTGTTDVTLRAVGDPFRVPAAAVSGIRAAKAAAPDGWVACDDRPRNQGCSGEDLQPTARAGRLSLPGVRFRPTS